MQVPEAMRKKKNQSAINPNPVFTLISSVTLTDPGSIA